ncbi:hypothetical protein [Aquibacillus kalidii]|uniref:hypothetical protein n=1 Tax=Aquibacillus kalidii TaxID=2762597 RepID=UPI0016470261|nr:hypothetical protein [Aquibacillus kalidii]
MIHRSAMEKFPKLYPTEEVLTTLESTTLSEKGENELNDFLTRLNRYGINKAMLGSRHVTTYPNGVAKLRFSEFVLTVSEYDGEMIYIVDIFKTHLVLVEA